MPEETSPARSPETQAPRAPQPTPPGADIAASLQAGRELGREYDDAIAAAIVERLDAAIDERVRQRLAEADGAGHAPKRQAPPRQEWTPRMTLALLAMIFAIPLSAIGAATMGSTGIIMAWAGITVFYVIAIIGGRR